MNIFISYSSKDADIANEICDALESSGLQCFIAPRNIRSGHLYAEEIIYGLEASDVLVLLLSDNSNASAHVLREIEWSVSNNLPIVTYKLSDVELSPSMKYFLMATQWLDCSFDGVHASLIDSLYDMDPAAINYEEPMPAPSPNTSGNVVENVVNINVVNNTARKTTNKTINKSATKKAKNNNYLLYASIAVACIILVLLGVLLAKLVGKNETKDNELASGTVSSEYIDWVTNPPASAVTDNSTSGSTITNDTATATTGDNASGTEVSATPTTTAEADKDYQLGDYVTLGSYNNEPIEWRVIYKYYNGDLILISDKVISFKAFDAAESGRAYYSKDGDFVHPNEETSTTLLREAYGSNNWMTSTLRFWLNSSSRNVSYVGQMPISTAMCDGGNWYEDEPGFLYNFTEAERDALKTTTQTILYLDENGTMSEQQVNDEVTLLSYDQVCWLEPAGVSVYTRPTDQAYSKDTGLFYEEYSINCGTNYAAWWLINCEEFTPSTERCVSNGLDGDSYWLKAFVEGIGVRPVITVDASKLP